MKEVTGIVENGQIRLPPSVRLPEHLEVRVVWDEADEQPQPYDREMLTEADVRADLAWATGQRELVEEAISSLGESMPES